MLPYLVIDYLFVHVVCSIAGVCGTFIAVDDISHNDPCMLILKVS